MNRLYFVILLFTVSLATFNCQKEISFTSPWNPAKAPVTATVHGNIVDENGAPVPGAVIRAGAKSATTNAKGYFRITEAPLDKNTSLVTAEMPGYFKAFRSFRATSGANYVNIKLLKKTVAGTVDAQAGGSVTLADGSKVLLPANGIVKANGGGSYSGTVNVYLSHIDPTSPDIMQTVPGSFMADDKDNKRVALASFGMLAVELESASGEKLQVAANAKATITTPIPASLESKAPATIALWYVDEKTGVWKEEGIATKSGNNYVGDVAHFTFWNCDISIPTVTLQATFQTGTNTPLVQTMVMLICTLPNGTTYAGSYTDSLGQVSGLVPANATMTLNVLDACYNIIYTQNIGPFSQNTNLGVITLSNLTLPSLITVNGNLKNCTNLPVTNGYAIISLGNFVYYTSTNSNGAFALTITTCGTNPTTLEITGVDNGAQSQGAPVTFPLNSSSINAGDLLACGVSTAQWINYTLDGTAYSMSTAANDSFFTYQQLFPSLRTGVWLYNPSTAQRFDFYFQHNAAPGNYLMDDIKLHNFDSVVLIQPYNVSLTEYPSSPGNFYQGTFSGSFTRPGLPSPIHTLNGSFRIRRTY